jgi:ribose/xylose/arabinose/galactoside ABC-type transport system permease subunit
MKAGSASSAWGRRQVALLVALAVTAAVFAAASPQFRSLVVLLDQSRYWCEIGILAPFALLVIVSGGIDLSAASILALCGVTIVRLHAEAGLPIAIAALVGLVLGAAAGAVNGVLIAVARIPDLVVTLATMAIYRGFAQAVAQNRVHSNLPAGYRFLGEGTLGGWMPAPWLIVLGVWVAAFIILHRARLGRHAFAIGASAPAARYAGVPVARAKIALYALSGLAAAAAAIIYTGRANTAKSVDGLGLELDAIAAAVLGGASIQGGRGSAIGVFLAVLTLGMLRTGLILLGVPELYQRMATGAILVGVAALNERAAAPAGRGGAAAN